MSAFMSSIEDGGFRGVSASVVRAPLAVHAERRLGFGGQATVANRLFALAAQAVLVTVECRQGNRALAKA